MTEPLTKREAEFFKNLCVGEDVEFNLNSPRVRHWIEQFGETEKQLDKMFPRVLRAVADQLDPKGKTS